VVVIELPTEQQALRFERYLKSGSGRAFAKRHFGPHWEPSNRSSTDVRVDVLTP
jgi:hypothetical protein